MWKILHASAVGTSHQVTGRPCQDHCDARIVPPVGGDVLIAACADGAGSAEHSDIGARVAVETFLSLAESHLAAQGGTATGPGLVESWAKAARSAIFAEAESRG